MDRIQALNAFILVAEEAGFSRAATELGISKSAASRQIAALEEALGAPLLSRTTRTVELTEAGRAYLDQVKAILASLAAADRAVTAPQNDLEGHLRVAAPIAFGMSRLARIAAAFMARHPKLVADIVLADRYVEPGEEGFDLSLRIELATGDPQGLRLAPVELGLFASPYYIARHGRPQAPSDLGQHPALCLGTLRRQIAWHLRGQVEPIQVSPRLVSNQAQVIREGAIAGLGIALLPVYFATEDMRSGRLQRLLDGFEPKPDWLCAYYPDDTATAKSRLFTDFLVEGLRRDA